MMFTCHEQNSSSHLHTFFICFVLPLFTYLIAKHKWWTQKEQVCFLVAVLIYLRLMHTDFVWLYCTLFRRYRNVMGFVCLYSAVEFLLLLDEGMEQRLVAASCVFPRNAMLFCLHRF